MGFIARILHFPLPPPVSRTSPLLMEKQPNLKEHRYTCSFWFGHRLGDQRIHTGISFAASHRNQIPLRLPTCPKSAPRGGTDRVDPAHTRNNLGSGQSHESWIVFWRECDYISSQYDRAWFAGLAHSYPKCSP